MDQSTWIDQHATGHLQVDGQSIPIVTANTVVVGTGAAGYCAADRLVMLGQKDVVMVTDKRRAGASRNAGSDKQTYYKLTLAGAEPDSVREMAETLFSGGSMDGDIALAEAAWSPRAFFHLVESGVPFPHNASGEYVGYKTDHDPRQRATSVGPYTSRTMVEKLEGRVKDGHGIPVLDLCRVVDLVVEDGAVVGLLCVRLDVGADHPSRFLLLRCTNLVYATGGPAGMYADSVYPNGQWGANGAALRAGVHGKNLTEWQFGLASIHPRWNVSGTYMQALPRFVSTDADGGDAREFLGEFLPDYGDQLTRIFLKGYQWPFDVRKAPEGSSLIDLLVYQETKLRGRRVWLDFRANPAEEHFDASKLSDEARAYLDATGVTGLGDSTPIERLQHMNRPAYEFYLQRNPGVDLETDMLEVAVCAQHNNGGLEVDQWWQSNLAGFFPVGEAAGAHGVYRPGGAALNSGQVGATRAASYIAQARTEDPVDEGTFASAAAPVAERAASLLKEAGARAASGTDGTDELLTRIRRLMSDKAGVVRSRESVAQAREEITALLAGYEATIAADLDSRRSVSRLFLIRDILTSQYVYLNAMEHYVASGGLSRGSVLYTDAEGDLPVVDASVSAALPELFRLRLDAGKLDDVIQVTSWDGAADPEFTWRERRPIPEHAEAFENTWRTYRENKNIG
ncbi:FAD-binding protein [Propioniciclava coleopterorum]|uniref:FAD-binding protein n=1 Tax=Propioniciclava coleopterorum TaxID=2714937 RepID=A0A6G7Y2Y8_9ACTN|nr:FAD-binding protein [Propioniciclava coleopterorum]QIK71069.1 FAD-binding protein [Propioniciclava coleopterorum]